MPRIAVVQDAPVLLDLDRSLMRLAEAVAAAVEGGARIVVFPEAFLPGYPTWIWRLRPGADLSLSSELHGRLVRSSVDIRAGGLAPLCQAAKKHGVAIVCGVNERDGEYSRATLYNTLVFIDTDGTLKNRHRKLVPTNPERMVWGPGDGSGLRVVELAGMRVGGLICWENYMPLARYALYAQGPELYVAPTWDSGEGWQATMRHITREAGCWVVGSAIAMQGKDVPDDFPSRDQLFMDPDEWLCPGGSVVVAPFGAPVAGPLDRERGILYSDCEPARVAAARRSLDVAGHYARPDIFRLEVTREEMSPVRFTEPSVEPATREE
jgi:nitrilase